MNYKALWEVKNGILFLKQPQGAPERKIKKRAQKKLPEPTRYVEP